ncbi:MAG TPA: cache domain-containing protein, partial [Holophagaceae bacterium]
MNAPSMRYRILAALLCGAAGFAVNLLRVEIFFNVDLLFGSAFAMLAILVAGPGAGIVAALIASSATVLAWNHPWAIVILATEAAAAGGLHARRHLDLLLADLLYWLILAPPLIWGFYHGALHASTQMTFLVILKQAINGLVNALLASLVHKAWRARFRPDAGSRPGFRPTVFVTLVSLVTFPALLLLAAFIRREIHHEEQLLVARSLELDRVTRQALHTWISDQHRVVTTLAALMGRSDLDAAERQTAVDTIRIASPAFTRLGVLDATATVTAYSPLFDDQGQSVLGRNFSDRPYLPHLQRTLRPYVADPVMGRVNRPEPIIPLLAPILRNGRYEGYCIGITDLSLLRDLLRSIAGSEGIRLTLLGRNGQVVSSSLPDLSAMAAYPRLAGTSLALGDGVVHRIPPDQRGQTRMQRWSRSMVVHEGLLSAELPWTVVVELPFAPLIDNLTTLSLLGLGTLLLLILGTVALAQALSRGFTESIAQLESATRAFPALLGEARAEPLALPASGIEEMHRLSLRFGQMAEALQGSFQELRGLKDTLEVRVATRTAELQTALDTIKTLQGIIPICASCKKIRDDQGAWNQLEAYISEHTD